MFFDVALGSKIAKIKCFQLLLLQDNPPGCTWIVLSQFSPQYLLQLPPLDTLVIFLNDQDETLTSVHRPCLECPVNVKKTSISAEMTDMDELTKLVMIDDRDHHGANISVSRDLVSPLIILI